MFKLESYITPLILSRVEKYVKNVRSEDSQVSLWGGDASLTNLDLKLDVLEEELKLPFKLVSGHIHELQIHVPWTRLQSEPIVLTINTIECVLRLPSGKVGSVSEESGVSQESSRKPKRSKVEEAAPGYIQNLVNKIISNVQVVCNNLILKYVEDDLVLSINVRHASIVSSDMNWETAFTELTPADLVMRKLLSVSDLTVCLDKRGAMGKIESYEDPLLYRCSLTARLSWCFQTIHSKSPFRTLFHFMMQKMDFSVTSRQMALLHRLLTLFMDFIRGDMRHEPGEGFETSNPSQSSPDHATEESEDSLTLGGLLWTVGSTVGSALLPIQWEDEDEEDEFHLTPAQLKEQSTSVVFNFKEIDLTLKSSKSVKSKGGYGGVRHVYTPFLSLSLQGVYLNLASLGQNWVNVQGGVSQFVLSPAGDPSSLHSFILAGCVGEKYLKDSLFEPRSPGEDTKNHAELNYRDNKSCDQHIDNVNETELLEKTPALGLDYIYNIEYPEDATSEDIALLSSNLEYSNLPERAICRLVVGPTNIHVDADLVKRINILRRMILEFDSSAPEVQDDVPTKLEIPTKEDIDSLENNNPIRVYQITILHPVLTFHCGDRKMETGVRCLDLTLHTPIYPLRNVKVGSMMHPPSRIILNNSHNSVSGTIVEYWCRIVYKDQQIKLLNLQKLKLTGKKLLLKNHWKNIYQKQGDIHVELENLEGRISMFSVGLVKEVLHAVSFGEKRSVEGLMEDLGPVLLCSCSRLSTTFTWTSKINTVSVCVGELEIKFANIILPYKPKFSLVFKGNNFLTQSPKKTSPIESWINLILQFPSGADTQFVPPIFYMRLGHSDCILYPGIVPLIQAICAPNLPTEPGARCEDSGFRSFDAALKQDEGVLLEENRNLAPEILKSTLFNIKAEPFNLYFCEDFSLAFSSEDMDETISKLITMKPGLGIINVGFPSIECYNTNGLVEEESLQHFPVLFPPAVWISGKNTLPLTLNMTGFQVFLVGETTSLLPVSTRCTLSMNNSENKSFAFAVHADITPVQFILEDKTVCKLVNVVQTIQSFSSKLRYSVDTVEVVRTKPDTSFAILQHSVSSVSESVTPVTQSQGTEPFQPIRDQSNTSVWLQCTIPSCTFSIISQSRTKISVCMEDSSLSYDCQATYSKISLRMRSLSSQSESLSANDEWNVHPFKDLIISCNSDLFPNLGAHIPESAREEVYIEEGSEERQSFSSGFINLVLTRAEVKNVHRKMKVGRDEDLLQDQGGLKYLSEIDLEVFPVDVFLTTDVLDTFVRCFLPFTSLFSSNSSKSRTSSYLSLNNNTLPLIYFKSKRSRLYVHDTRLEPGAQDFFLLETESARLTCQVENPLSRILVNEEMYYSAAEAGYLEIPGSVLEDRQYQLDISGINLLTGRWQDIMALRERPTEKILLRTMSENPAFEWNLRSNPDTKKDDSFILYPVFHNINFKLNFAPAIVYSRQRSRKIEEYLVGGISLEMNTYSDIRLFISLQQITFFNSILELTRDISRSSVSPETVPVIEEYPPEISVPAELLLTCNSIKLMVYEDIKPCLEPLFMTTVTQPHIFSVISPTSQKITLSLYTFQASTPTLNLDITKNTFINESMFANTILESRPVPANTISGMRPSFLNLTLEGFLSSNLLFSTTLGRPFTILLDLEKVKLLNSVNSKYLDSRGNTEAVPFKSPYKQVQFLLSTNKTGFGFLFKTSKTMLLEHRFTILESSLKLDFGEELNIETNLVFQQLRSLIELDGLVHSLLDPVNLDISAHLTSDLEFHPLRGTVIFTLGRASFHLGPHHSFVLDQLATLIKDEFGSTYPEKENIEDLEPTESVSKDGEYFTDDLRLGTFTVQESKSSSDIPLAYNVNFNKSSLTWTYPRPRTLTKMVILPLPLTIAQDGLSREDSVACQLQFWSGTRSCWMLYQHFQLQEGNATHLDLPLCTDRRGCEFAKTWRVQMFPVGNIRDEIPCSLLSALRVDSFYSSSMLPNFQVVLCSSHVDITLHNHLNFVGTKLEDDLNGLGLDTSLPKDQPFLTGYIESVSSEICLWNEKTNKSAKLSARGRVGVQLTDYLYLAKHHFIKPCDVSLKLQTQKTFLDVFTDIGTAEMILGPFAIHTLSQSFKLWEQSWNMLENPTVGLPFIPLTQIMIVNETSRPLLFGQVGTDEKILAESRTLLMYTWRSHKSASMIRLSSSMHTLAWSDSFSLQEGESLIRLDDSSQLVIQVQMKSSTLRVVRFMGLVTVINLLQDHIELKLLSENTEDQKHVAGSFERPVSLITELSTVGLKLKLFGLFTPWSGEISLKNPRKSSLVRLPQREKGTSVTIWCNLFKENIGASTRTLVVFSPMYIVQSLVPGRLTTHIQCEDVESEIILPGFNTSAQLELQHAPENKFNLCFQLSPDTPPSSPPVSVSWGIIDQVKTSKSETRTHTTMVNEIMRISRSKLNSVKDFRDLTKLKIVDQCGSECQVRFEEIHPALNTLKVIVQSKLLIVNETELNLVVNSGKDFWFMDPNSVLHPPLLKSVFKFGLLTNKGEEYFGSSLEITDHDWTYVSLLPNHEKIIPMSGNIIYQVKCGERRMFLNIHSEMVEGTRLVTLQPMFIFTNQLETRVRIKPAVSCRKSLSIQYSTKERTEESILDLECGNQEQGLLWNMFDKGDAKPDFLISVSCSGNTWTRNISIPTDSDKRQCFCLSGEDVSAYPCLLINHRLEGQVHVVLLKDERPQFRIRNKLLEDIEFGEVSESPEYLKTEHHAFYTCRYIQDGYPYVMEDHEKNRIAFRKFNSENIWSQSVDISLSQETFLNLPGYGDIKLRINSSLPISEISVEPVSNMEISAKDIRARFQDQTEAVGTPSPEPLEIETVSSTNSFVMLKRSQSSTRRTSVDHEPNPIKDVRPVFTMVLKMKEFDVAITDDLCNFPDIQEIVRLTLTDTSLKILPNLMKMMKGSEPVQQYRVQCNIGDLQLDNQMYDRGLYQFPVVINKPESSESRFLELNFTLDQSSHKRFLNNLTISLSPVCLNLEDTFFYVLQEYGKQFGNIGTREVPSISGVLPIRVRLNIESSRNLMFLDRICINDICLQVSVHASVKLFLGLEDTVLNLARFEKEKLWCSGYSIGHTLSRHYLSGALFKAGWVVGSLDMIGNPAAFTRNVTEGIKDFVALPCEGIFNGPWGFLVGLTLGSSSLVKHVSAGTLTSITNFAKSVSRNLDKLSFDNEHWQRNEAARRQKPRGVTEGVISGLSGIGVSVLGAIGGIAHHPIQILINDGVSPIKLMGGVGKGLVGIVAKPLGGAAELIALTGQGLLVGSGWSKDRKAIKMGIPSLVLDLVSSDLKFQWKISLAERIVCSVDASLHRDNQYIAVTCILTHDSLIVMNEEQDDILQIHNLKTLSLDSCRDDPSLTVLKIYKERSIEDSFKPSDRVAQFVLDSIQFSGNHSECSEHEIASLKHMPEIEDEFLLYINPGLLEWFSLSLENTKENLK